MNNDLRQSNPTVRFWAFINNSMVRIAIHPGQTLHHSAFQHTDEGFERFSRSWTHDGRFVSESSYCRSRDCDGLYENWWERECEADRMAAVSNVHVPGHLLPEWRHLNSNQRDHSAEAAGY